MSTPSASDVLIPEGIGLLFEELSLDDTLDAQSSVALVRDLAALRPVPAARQARLSALLSAHILRAAALVRARSQLVADAQQRHLHLSRVQLSAAERILEHAPGTRIIVGLGRLPREVATLALHDFLSDYGRVERAAAEVQKAWKPIDGWVLPTAMTELDLPADARALRDNGGFLAFFFGAPAAYARDRVKPHLAARHQNITPAEMADVLDRLSAYRSAASRLRALVESAHPWVPWAVNVTTGKVSQRRVASLRWMLTEVEAGNLGSAERSMLSEDSQRRLLTREPAISWSKALREPGPAPGVASLGGLVVPVDRFMGWLAHPPQVTPEEFDEFVRAFVQALPQIAAALLIADLARTDRALGDAVRATVTLSQGAFGPADQNRSRFRAIVASVHDQAGTARAILEPLRPQHPHVIALVGELRDAQGLILEDLRVQAPARGPLRVAIAGRTKAGKTTLRKALTRDLTEEGIGRGAHRTTRTADAFSWDQITFVDTPGVSAKDDEYDKVKAEQACRDADAVVWMFAESLHAEEAEILQALLTVKPVLVVYNAKGKVGTEHRLGLFARNPELTFTDKEGHAERSRQMAELAGVRNPLFVAVHANAARQALISEGETHPAWPASQVPVLEDELRRVLASQSRGLRSLRLSDQSRTPLLAAGGRAAAVVDELGPRCATFEHRIAQEQRDLRGAAQRAVDRAAAQMQKGFASLAAALPAWLEKVDGRHESPEKEWSAFVAGLPVNDVLTGIEKSLQAEARASGLLLDREDQLEEKLQRAQLNATVRKGIPLLSRAWRFLRRLGSLVLRNAPRFAREAKLGPVGWAALAADVLATGGRAVVEDVTDSRIDRKAWEQNADQAARKALEELRLLVLSELDKIAATLHTSIEEHFAQSRTELACLTKSLAAMAALERRAAASIAEIDVLTVERLLQLGDVRAGEVIAVDRVPNRDLRVTVSGAPAPAERWLTTVLDGCSTEVVTVTRKRRKTRRAKELQA